MSDNAIDPKSKAVRRPTALNIVLWVFQVLLAAFFIFAALPKLIGDPTTVQMYDLIGFGQWFRYLTGVCELAGAIALLIPRLSSLAAAGLSCVMVGATIANITALKMNPTMTIVLIVVFALISWGRWPYNRLLLQTITRRNTSGPTPTPASS